MSKIALHTLWTTPNAQVGYSTSTAKVRVRSAKISNSEYKWKLKIIRIYVLSDIAIHVSLTNRFWLRLRSHLKQPSTDT